MVFDLGAPTLVLLGMFGLVIALPMSWLLQYFGIARGYAIAAVLPPFAFLMFWVVALKARKLSSEVNQ